MNKDQTNKKVATLPLVAASTKFISNKDADILIKKLKKLE